jgi:hypothetical protein
MGNSVYKVLLSNSGEINLLDYSEVTVDTIFYMINEDTIKIKSMSCTNCAEGVYFRTIIVDCSDAVTIKGLMLYG